MMKKLFLVCIALAGSLLVTAKEYHVSQKTGADTHDGTAEKPFKTISKAAEFAYPGDVITVHEGVYRERINPPRGGECDLTRIVYRAAPGERAVIKGSEVVTGWESVGGGVWKKEIDDTFFGNFNPFRELIEGDWFNPLDRIHHLGDIYLNGKSLYEMDTREALNNPKPRAESIDPEGEKRVWFVEPGDGKVTLFANFGTDNPNKALVEVAARTTCFYPEKEGVNYITLSGFEIAQAASQWAAPTAEQIGMVATHWNKGWIIENNIMHDARCSALTLGKERGTGHNVWSNAPEKDGSLHYIEVTMNTLRHGWSKENIGSHIVRGNTIYNCEQTGICGSQGAAFSDIYDNHIYNIWYKRQFNGAEIAGIKFHAAIDTYIHHNRLNNCARGLWLDWMSQGVHVFSNLIYDSPWEDVFFEVDHGPYMVYNNILLSRINVNTWSHGGLFAHNIMAGVFNTDSDKSRYTPYHLPHSTQIKGFSIIFAGDDRHINNIYVANENKAIGDKLMFGTKIYDEKTVLPILMEDNTFFEGAAPSKYDVNARRDDGFNPQFTVIEKGNEVYLRFNIANIDLLKGAKEVTAERIGVPNVVEVPYEYQDGTPLAINTDYFGNKRTEYITGPFATLKNGVNEIKVW